MQKLLVFALVFVFTTTVAYAAPVIHYTPYDRTDGDVAIGDDDGKFAGTYSIDIDASNLDNATHLVSTGELAVVCSGGVTINSVGSLSYKGDADTNIFWDPGMGLLTLAVQDDTQNARVGAATIQLTSTFMLSLNDDCIENILVDWDGTPGTLTIIPNNTPNAFGNTSYAWTENSTLMAANDLEATGGSVLFSHDPAQPTDVALSLARVSVKAGRDRAAPADMLIALGTIAQSDATLEGLTDITVTVASAANTFINQTISLAGTNATISAKGALTYKDTTTGPISTLKLDLPKNKLFLLAKNIDLTGLADSLTISIQAGNYLITGSADETVINGSRPIPISLLSGNTDAIRLDKAKVAKKADSLFLRGGIATEQTHDLTATGTSLTIIWDSQSFTIPNTAFSEKTNNKFTAKYTDPATSELINAIIDLNKCTFKTTIKKATALTDTGTVNLTIQFDSFSETAPYTLP